MRRVPPQAPAPDATDPAPGGGGSGLIAMLTDDDVEPEEAEESEVNDDPEAPVPRPSATSHANLVGQVLADRFRLLKLIGEGGMGSVYAAEHVTIGRKLAVKVLSPEFGDSPEVVDRFLQEARTASMLHHEHIVDITDFGYTKHGQAFLTMEYLEGENLADLVEREGRLPWTRVRRMILQICRALNAAHEKGIIHRDMKPDNCFRIKRGGNPDFIKILDFGIAKVIDGAMSGRGDRPKMATEAGTLLGTPEYMAPEIARDQKSDARVDVYSLGILLYELLTGSVPFKGQTFMATVAMQMVDEPQPPSLRAPDANIPPSIETVILLALRKDPAERFQSVRELAEAIIEADRTLRLTQQGLPALHFESGEYAAASVNTGRLDTSGMLAGQPSNMLAASATLPPLPLTLPPGGPASLAPVAAAAATGAHRTIQPEPTTAASETAIGEDEPRANPYRMFSLFLLLIVLGLGGAIWYLLQRRSQGAEEDPDTAAQVDSNDPGAAPQTPPEKDEPDDKPATTQGPDDGKENAKDPKDKPIKKSSGEPKKPAAPAGTIEPTSEDMDQFVKSILGDVSRCASTNGLPRQRVTIYVETEAGTGKVDPNVENPRDNAAFVSCAEKAVAKKRFKKGRKQKNFRAHLDI